MSKSEYLPPECWQGMYRVMQRANVNAMRVSLETGMRIDDVLSLQTAVLFASAKGKKKISYIAKKTGKAGTAEISTDLWRELRAGAGDIWLFPGKNPEKHRTRQAVYNDVKKAAKLLGLEGQISPHSARKTFAVELRKQSGINAVQKALQHADRETTKLYAFADIAERSAAPSATAEEIASAVCEKIEQMFVKYGIFERKSP